MVYDKLADIYDALVGDESAWLFWVDFVVKNISGPSILELACGSGEITSLLAKKDYQILATDISNTMLQKAKTKINNPNVSFKILDMKDYSLNQEFSGIICFCDSVNYLKDYLEFQRFIECCHKHLNKHGVLLFDMHHNQRLKEFENSWKEKGIIDNISYSWEITNQDNKLYHDFILKEKGKSYHENHIQTIFDLKTIKNLLKDTGFKVEVFDDYDIFNEDLKERYFFKAWKP